MEISEDTDDMTPLDHFLKGLCDVYGGQEVVRTYKFMGGVLNIAWETKADPIPLVRETYKSVPEKFRPIPVEDVAKMCALTLLRDKSRD
jgi:hypothetical protein